MEDLEQGLGQRTAEDLLPTRADAEVIKDTLVEAVCRAEGEKIFNLAEDKLEAAKAYASGVEILLAIQK